MSELSRATAIDLISSWSTKDVIEILKKNDLESVCSTVEKKQVDGDELLHLTEGKLSLWKRDLPRPTLRNLWNFLERLNRTPQKFVYFKPKPTEEEVVSDTGSWDTDFEDDDENDDEKTSNQQQNQNETTFIPERSQNFRNSLLMFQNSDKIPEAHKKSHESDSDYPAENIYMNDNFEENICPDKKQLDTCSLVENLNLDSSLNKSPVLQGSKGTLPKCSEEAQKYSEKSDELPRPPVMLTNFDLLANLPPKTEESEDEYEPFDEKIIEENKKKFASCNSINESLENFTDVSDSCHGKDEEIYESITETPEDTLLPNLPSRMKESPPPLPAKVLPPIDSLASMISTQKQLNETERSPDKKSSLLELRATRPLPPPPEKQSYMDCPWFHNVTREQGISLIKERAFNGYFLLRPSSSNPNNPLALVLWFKDRVYNVPVRKRPDNRFALGSPKINEQTFPSVEDIVKFHSREALMLNSAGIQTGSTKLTETPSK